MWQLLMKPRLVKPGPLRENLTMKKCLPQGNQVLKWTWMRM
uniref:Uncharacterized protein n=1 Tax=Rhizophora mucronata TaxID=61149 RepID=A0A2P2MRU6_RHIMU